MSSNKEAINRLKKIQSSFLPSSMLYPSLGGVIDLLKADEEPLPVWCHCVGGHVCDEHTHVWKVAENASIWTSNGEALEQYACECGLVRVDEEPISWKCPCEFCTKPPVQSVDLDEFVNKFIDVARGSKSVDKLQDLETYFLERYKERHTPTYQDLIDFVKALLESKVNQ